jgi:hypothetical protein
MVVTQAKGPQGSPRTEIVLKYPAIIPYWDFSASLEDDGKDGDGGFRAAKPGECAHYAGIRKAPWQTGGAAAEAAKK